MYIVLTNDTKCIDLSVFKSSATIVGVFEDKYLAEEWVDNHCYKSYFTIMEVTNAQTFK